jgi:hypothetical protein
MEKSSKDPVILAAGLFFSLLAVIALPDFYYHKDVAAFWEWGQAWQAGWQAIYLSCAQCNYPLLGMFGSAGLMGLLSPLGVGKAVFFFRVILGLVDGLNVCLVFWLLKKFSVERAAYWAGVLGVSICSWVGGALWGQIDGLSQFSILAALAWLVKGNLRGWSSKTEFRIFLAAGSLLLASVILIKQLTIFSVLPLGLLFGVTIIFFSRQWREFLLNSTLALAVFFVAIFIWDPFLKLPAPYFSHLSYVWGQGSYHGDLISRDGFNLWMFLGRDMLSSSHVPLFEKFPLLTPYGLGMFFFIVYLGVITLSFLLFLRQQFQRGETFLNREVLLNGIFYLALVNLSFNVLLTGTHERYLYHFYPYLILAWAGLGRYQRLFSDQALSVFVLGASLYGLLILKVLPDLDFQLGYWPNWLLGLFHFGLLVYLTGVLFKYQKPLAGAPVLESAQSAKPLGS